MTTHADTSAGPGEARPEPGRTAERASAPVSALSDSATTLIEPAPGTEHEPAPRSSGERAPRSGGEPTPEAPSVEDVRVAFADAWGDMGPAWNVTPSVARVHGYLLVSAGTLTEREIRGALGLSHRATSLALAELEGWQLVARVEDVRRDPRPGPAAVAWHVAGDRWRWFQRVAEERRAREADPLQPRLRVCLELADEAVRAAPGDLEAQQLRSWIAEIRGLATLFDRALRALSRAETAQIARGFGVLARVSDETLDRLLQLFGSLPEDELSETLESISRTSPTTARRVLRAANRISRLAH